MVLMSFLLIFLIPLGLLFVPVIFLFGALFDRGGCLYSFWNCGSNCLCKLIMLLILIPIILVIGLAGGVLALAILLIPGVIF